MTALLVVAMCWLTGAALVAAGDRLPAGWRRWPALTTMLAGLLLIWVVPAGDEPFVLAAGLRVDLLALLVLTAVMLSGIVGLCLESMEALPAGKEGLLLLSQAGAGFCAMAGDLVFLLAGAALAVLPAAVAVLGRGEAGREGALKTVLIVLLALALCGLGTALVHLRLGSASFEALAAFLGEHSAVEERFLQTALLLWLAGTAVLVAVFPVHMWFVDLTHSQGASMCAVCGGGVMTALLAATARLWSSALAPAGPVAIWVPSLQLLGLLSLWAGILAALVQKNSRRFLALLLVGQNGLFLLGLSAASGETAAAVAPACGVLLLGQVLAWLGLLLGLPGGEAGEVAAGSESESPRWRWLFGLSLLWAAGLPPLAGFWARLQLLQALITKGEEVTALLAALAMGLLFAGCLWRLRGRKDTPATPAPPAFSERLLAVILFCLMLGLALFPAWIFHLAAAACTALF